MALGFGKPRETQCPAEENVRSPLAVPKDEILPTDIRRPVETGSTLLLRSGAFLSPAEATVVDTATYRDNTNGISRLI